MTKQKSDRHAYRLPRLRNVALTAPYFHNASVATLDEAVRPCAIGGTNHDLTAGETEAILAFLGALSGELPEQQAPELP